MNEQNYTLSSQYEAEFKRENLKRSFRGTLYATIGGATLFGVISSIMMKLLEGGGALAAMPYANILITAGIAAAGITFSFLAQREFNEQKIIQDEHLARKNAECQEQQKSHSIQLSAPQPEKLATGFENPGRADGKAWEQYVIEKSGARIETCR